MRAALITAQGTPVASNVKLVLDHPEPAPGRAELRIRVLAAALNHLDLWVGRGVPGIDLTYPRISGSDGCGIVDAVGGGVPEDWIGRKVIFNAAVPQDDPLRPGQPALSPTLHVIGEHTDGAMAEKVVVPAANVAEAGADADPVAAAAYGLAHLTAWRMLVTRAGLRPGQIVLITGIGGGVALAALNIARHVGCTTIVTSRHQWKLDRASELGADHGVLDTGEEWSREVRRITAKRGVDICADSVGQAIFASCVLSLSPGGTYVTCGCTSGPEVTVHLIRMFWLQQRIVGSTMGDMHEFREVLALFRRGLVKPVIDSVHEAQRVDQAYARLESGEQFGKVVVRWESV